jgi:hypothetical protein
VTSLELQRFNQAIALAQSGNKFQAHQILTELVSTQPNDPNLLLWLAFTSEDLTKARTYLEKVAWLEPANPSLASAQSWLQTEEAKQRAMSTPSPVSGFNAQTSNQPAYGYSSNNFSYTPANSYTTANNQQQAAQPLEYGRYTYPKEGKKRNWLLLGFIIAAPFLFMGFIIALLMIIRAADEATPDSVANQGLPVYSGARHLHLTQTDRGIVLKSFQNGLASTGVSNVQISSFEVYTIKANDRSKAISFYETEVKKIGWQNTSGNAKTIGSSLVSIYMKGTNFFGFAIGNITTNDGPLNDSRYNVGADEQVLVAFSVKL